MITYTNAHGDEVEVKTFDTLRAISATTSMNEKKAILKEALDNLDEHPMLIPLFNLGLNYQINTYITKSPDFDLGPTPRVTDFDKLFVIFKAVHSKLINGERLSSSEWSQYYYDMLAVCTLEDFKFIDKAMIKDFTIGLAVKSFNSVSKHIKIPFFDTMRVSSINTANIDYSKGAYVGTKKDGVNATVEVNSSLISRNGQTIALRHLEEILVSLSGEYVVFGELVSTTRQSSSGLVNSAIKSMYDTKLTVQDLALHIFDAMTHQEYESRKFVTPFKDRIKLAEELVNTINHPMIQFVEQDIVYSKDEALVIYERVLSMGEEGIIVNDSDAVFEIKRTKLRARVKAEETTDVLIVGVIPHAKNPNWVGSLIITSADEVVSSVGSGLTEDMMADFMINSPVGKIIEIKYNSVIPNSEGTGWTFFLPTIGKKKELRFDKHEPDTVLDKVKKEE